MPLGRLNLPASSWPLTGANGVRRGEHARVLFFVLPYRHDDDLVRRQARRQYKSLIIAVDHDYGPYHACT